jgi:hypothetical protein
VRKYTNLGWPDTPFGADKRPFPRTVHLIAAAAVQWATEGERFVPAATALIYLPVCRHGSSLLLPETLHAGYRVAVIDGPGESPDAVALIDGHLVQGRRHATALAVHDWEEDASLLLTFAAGETPGITAVAAALATWEPAERGTAQMVDTARDIEHATPVLPEACHRHGLGITVGDGGLLSLADTRAAYEEVTAGQDQGVRDSAAQALGLSVLCQGLVTALLAGEAIGGYTWSSPFPVDRVISNVAWDAFPEILPGLQPARVSGG